MQTIEYKEFGNIELRVGTINRVEIFEKARKPAYKIWVDLGPEIGVKKSSAQVTANYSPQDLLDRQVVCVCNLAPRQIADFMSEILITGFEDEQGAIVLTTVERPVPNGSRLY
ncbi:tRNA-binding protein [Algoriphagus halophytocola]|uniref:tRNA-binding protein n=1 Tax=Algoriphagus halophytocola TaxID=2991499 RepID=A0ABY6MEG3_9BACT|nr:MULTISPECIES: tRNA-binding protein [unclassified Algoriphagus]UZD21310.1 tRNA-binding protein [Algoriphagus sp. TR-M5]WBL42521.1 tRNA-binding protein [Algoriphagus sp. TR-M9]